MTVINKLLTFLTFNLHFLQIADIAVNQNNVQSTTKFLPNNLNQCLRKSLTICSRNVRDWQQSDVFQRIVGRCAGTFIQVSKIYSMVFKHLRLQANLTISIWSPLSQCTDPKNNQFHKAPLSYRKKRFAHF